MESALYSGLSKLTDIVHTALKGQTSPLLLPPDQIELVQTEVLKASTADLDPDFSRMQSLVVSDPTDPTMLLVLISASALARKNLEMVELIPLPGYGSKGTYVPKPDYVTVALSQIEERYTVLEKDEVQNCMNNKCYMSNQARPINDRSCGIPQYFSNESEGCDYEEITSNGIFVKPLLPDGVLFSFRKPVRSQLFCNTDKAVGESRMLEGAGVLNIPPGCQVTVSNYDGNNLVIKGLPIPHLISADDIKLISAEQEKVFQMSAESIITDLERRPQYQQLLQQSVDIVKSQVEDVDNKVKVQGLHAWVLTGLVTTLLLVIVAILGLLYKYRELVRRKWRTLRTNVGDVSRILADLRIRVLSLGNRESRTPPTRPRPRSAIIRFRRSSTLDPEYLSMHDEENPQPANPEPSEARATAPIPYPREQLRDTDEYSEEVAICGSELRQQLLRDSERQNEYETLPAQAPKGFRT
jgi:hypothetical protein